MEQKRGAELSDSALEGVAGGINTVSVNSGNYTYSPARPAVAGPSTGPAGGSSCVIESAGEHKLPNKNIWALLMEAGTIDQL